ncbi:MAG: hypothetical protein FWF82_06595, partial [Oscillospiraceae bacterium]|nr:hypothetical protein [Oscillospiraceae bacterium]
MKKSRRLLSFAVAMAIILGLFGTSLQESDSAVTLPPSLPAGVQPMLAPDESEDGRISEYLNRGVVAIATGRNAFISWRLLATEPQNIGFNLYRITDGVTTKLNTAVLTGGTNFTDTTVNLSKDNTYFVTTVLNGVENATDGVYTLKANSPQEVITVPLKPGGQIQFVWVGDFNGDGSYDFLIDRVWDEHQSIEAYLQDGTFLWSVNLGPNSVNKNNISPGASTISVGHWDGVTVYDLDGNGSADVILRAANGVIFADGAVFNTGRTNADSQSIVVIDGMTGKLKAHAPVPEDYIARGPLAAQLGIGFLDGEKPSLVAYMKNRNSNGSFNLVQAAYSYTNGAFAMDWKWLRGNQDIPDGHHMRIADVNGDGKDEIVHIGGTLNGNGTVRYSLGSQGIVHGDRFYVGYFNKDDKVMSGYGVQQDNPDGIIEYGYNAATGEVLWKNTVPERPGPDVGRANIGDIDPRSPGYEVWSFSGTLENKTGKSVYTHNRTLYPVLRLWWDGDLGSESFNDSKIEGWDYINESVYRISTTWRLANTVISARGAPHFYGDILGDWREEVVMASSDYSELHIFTTPLPSEHRMFSLTQDQSYRNCLTIKGYQQSHMPGFYLGFDMDMPKPPAIKYAKKPDGVPSKTPDSTSTVTTSATSTPPATTASPPVTTTSVMTATTTSPTSTSASVTTAPIPLLNGTLIKNLDIFDSTNRGEWSIQYDVKVGDEIYGCYRPFTFTTLSAGIAGLEWIKVSGNSKAWQADMAEFTAGEDLTAYIGLDSRVEELHGLPVWVESWKLTDMTAETVDGSGVNIVYHIYEKTFKKGETVELGA